MSIPKVIAHNKRNMTTMTTLQILIGARDLIANTGWIQKARESANGYDIDGAIDAASGCDYRDSALYDAREQIRKAFRSRYPRPWGLNAWNDAPGRTKQEVLDLFSEAISALTRKQPEVRQ